MQKEGARALSNQTLVSPLTAWMLRLLLAALLFFGAEILLWIDLPARTLVDWLILPPIYIGLAAVLLDLTVRFRVKDAYGVMLVVALYALCVSALANPAFTLDDYPRTLITRAIGGNGLIGLEMVGLLLVLLAGDRAKYRRYLLGFALGVGFIWGIWLRWLPESLAPMPQTETVALYAVLTLLLVGVLYVASLRYPVEQVDHLRLTLAEWGLIGGVGIVLVMVRLLDESLTLLALVGNVALILLCYGVIWSQRSPHGRTLMDDHLPPRLLSPLWVILVLIVFAGSAVLAYALPELNIAGYNQYSLVGIGFAAVGFLWLPLIAAVLSVRAIDYYSRTGQW